MPVLFTVAIVASDDCHLTSLVTSAPPLRLPRKEIVAANCRLAPTAMAVLAGVICKRTGPICALQGSASASTRTAIVTEFQDFIAFLRESQPMPNHRDKRLTSYGTPRQGLRQLTSK